MEELTNFVVAWRNKLRDEDIVKIIKMCSDAILKEKQDNLIKEHNIKIQKIYEELEK
tara:strand:+ start:400 stop:570 length:171 start_codon:yes stop_codon:yes gene_type:complete